MLIDTWLNKIGKSKTPVTVKVYKSALNCVLSDLKMSAEEVKELSFSNPEKLRDIIEEYFVNLGLAPLTKNQRLSALRSFLNFANRAFNLGKIEFDKSHTLSSIFDTEVPDKIRLKKAFEHADLRTRAAMALYAFCGLRPRIIVNLPFSAFVEKRIKDGEVIFKKEPTMIVIRKDIPGNKAKVDLFHFFLPFYPELLHFFTFLIKDGMDFLKEYIESRDDEFGEENTVIYYPETNNPEVYLWRGIKKAFKQAGIRSRPYVLRSYFDIVASESLSQTKREFYMGHAGDLDVRYSMRKKHSREKMEEFRIEWKEKMEKKLALG